MCFEIGQRVAVLDDTLKGVVIAVDADTITLEDEEGMQYHYPSKELVVIHEDQFEISKYTDIAHDSLLQQKISAENTPKKSSFKTDKKEVILEVDLHIHQLVSSTKHLDTYDILNHQLMVAKSKLEFAIRKRIPKLVFIHGVGEGVLKAELLRLLERYALSYQDASYQKYGMGATEVYIPQNYKS